MRIVLIILLALLLGGGGTFAWLYFGGFGGESGEAIAFVNIFSEYSEVAEEVERLVYLPGTEKNTNRADLLALLNIILTEEIDKERREELARLAFTNLDVIKKEIDSAQATQAKLYQILQDLDNASKSFSSIELRKQTEKIVFLARKRAEISSRITSILSETNDHTYAIITRILSDKGELTQEHITEINNTTKNAEERFSTLEGLYSEIEAKKQEMDSLFNTFVAVAI